LRFSFECCMRREYTIQKLEYRTIKRISSFEN